MLLATCLNVAVAGCLVIPQRTHSVELLDRLAQAHSMLRSTPPQIDPGCEAVGDVQTQLSGEPGLSEVQPTWTLLRSAADALTAVCGQLRLLALPASSTAAVRDAQQRWRDGLARELDTACDQLHAAAASLGRSPPSC